LLVVDDFEQYVSECPPCKQICKVPYKDCEHLCEVPCHDPIPPSPPIVRKKQKKKNWKPAPRPKPPSIEEVKCQPCPKIVSRLCLGEHQVSPPIPLSTPPPLHPTTNDANINCKVACSCLFDTQRISMRIEMREPVGVWQSLVSFILPRDNT